MDEHFESPQFVSRGGQKLAAALEAFGFDVTGLVCADLGSHVGGFVDCLLQRGADKVYSVDTSYGTLAWKLRKNPRVVVLERSNAMHVILPEAIDVVTIDVGWTPQARILPSASRLVRQGGSIISLIKPHYEAHSSELEAGVLSDTRTSAVLDRVRLTIESLNLAIAAIAPSPIRGHGGNKEFFAYLQRSGDNPAHVSAGFQFR